jgi:Cu(I)/Ag(I) efflux system membrane fusion protein
MHPWITSDKPGNCTICGMALVPVYEGQAGMENRAGVVALNPRSLDVLAVTTVPVRRLELTKSLRFSGILEDDENIHRVIAAFYDGRIDQIYVEHVGKYVEKGQLLAAIYSPELLYVVREYQDAIRGENDSVARNSAQRLVQYGLSAEQVTNLGKQQSNVFTIDLLAPISGTVVTKKALKGQYIKTGEPLFEMGNLSRLWFHAEVYERDLPDIRIGQKAILRTPTVPGREFEGIVTFIDPNFDPRTRSTKVRVEVDNPVAEGDARGLLRVLPHRAYAEAEIAARLGEALVVPRSAVLRDGRRSVVYTENASGEFEQRAVRTGRVGDEGIEILEGLKEGERVLAQGNLMIDAEAQLRGSIAPKQQTPILSKPVGEQFLKQLAEVSKDLAADDAVAAVTAGQRLRELAEAMGETGDAQTDQLLAQLRQIPKNPVGSDLKALRQSFLPWSTLGADLALALKRAGQNPDVTVFECPMTGDSFPGAPSKAKWVQFGSEILNPYFGAEMLSCGAEVRP